MNESLNIINMKIHITKYYKISINGLRTEEKKPLIFGNNIGVCSQVRYLNRLKDEKSRKNISYNKRYLLSKY